MPSEFRMPALGADMDEGTVVQWNVAPGSTVKRGDVVAVVETDKGAIDVEIFQDGVVRELLVQPGTKVPVGTVLALLDAEGAMPAPAAPGIPVVGSVAAGPAASAAAVASAAPGAAVTPAAPATPATPPSSAAPAAPPGRARISPAARRRARELAVDLDSVRGTGPGGAITIEDVERAGGARKPAPEAAPAAAGEAAAKGAGGGMREAIASAMSRSKREIPHYYLSLAVDVTPVTEWLAATNAAKPVTERLLFAALLVKAVALACHDVPGFSGYYRAGRFEPGAAVHVGVAVAIRGGGLVAPAIMDTADKPLAALMEDFRGLVMRARAGRLRASELAAPTIILTSLGDSAVDAVFPIIQPPQVAIVGAGAPARRPWVVDGVVTARQVLTLSLGADHRVTDGRLGAQFLARVAELLVAPGQL